MCHSVSLFLATCYVSLVRRVCVSQYVTLSGDLPYKSGVCVTLSGDLPCESCKKGVCVSLFLATCHASLVRRV